MSRKYSKPMTIDELSKVADKDIDLSEIPELDEAFWREARRIDQPLARKSVHLKIDEDVFDFFKRGGKGHLSRMQAVLRAYVDARTRDTNRELDESVHDS